MFSSEIFEDLHRTKNKVTTSNFCYSTTIFSDLIFFYYFSFLWIFLSEIYLFCSIFLLDKCFVFISTLLCCIYLFDWCFFLIFTLLFVFLFFYICNYLFWLYFSLGRLILLSDFLFVVYCSIDFFRSIDCILFDQLIVYCFVFLLSSTIFLYLFLYYFCV